jgi:hypothetical protein
MSRDRCTNSAHCICAQDDSGVHTYAKAEVHRMSQHNISTQCAVGCKSAVGIDHSIVSNEGVRSDGDVIVNPCDPFDGHLNDNML